MGKSRRFALVLVTAAATLGMAASVAAASSGPVIPVDDPFYSYSGALGGVAPGTVLRTRTVSIAENGSATPISATQILYRTTGELGQPTVTVTTVIRPSLSLVTKIVAYQTAYDALGSECDPSYTLQGGNASYSTAQQEEQIILGYVNAGDTVVVSDYEGEQLDWGAGHESGYNTLDGIRAAEHELGASAASTPVGMVGYSGGSIATDFAAELAPTYAPELDLVGTAEGGVPADFFHNLNYINGSPSWSGVIPAVLVGLGRAYNVNFQQYLNSYGIKITSQVADECINNFVGAYPGLTIQSMTLPQYQNPYTIPSFVDIGNKLIMSRTGTPKEPLFMGVGDADGTGDGVMVTADDEALAYTYCQRGVSVQFNVYQGDDHTQAAVPFEQGALSFLTQRLNGQAVTNGCSSITPGNSLAPMTVSATNAPPPTHHSAPVTKVRFQDLGRKRRKHGVEVKLWTSAGTVNGMTVTVRSHGKLVERFRLAHLTTRKRALYLRHKGRMLAAGTYTLTITHAHATVFRRTFKVR